MLIGPLLPPAMYIGWTVSVTSELFAAELLEDVPDVLESELFDDGWLDDAARFAASAAFAASECL